MKLALAFLLVASTTSAGPVVPEKKIGCRVDGAMVVEVKLVQLGSEPAGHVTKIFSGEGWRAQEIDKAGKVTDQKQGCLDNTEVHDLQAKLDKAKWKITTARNHCMAMATTSTEYTVKGKVVWTERMCSGQTLDKDSAAAIDAVKAALAKLKP
jgi:hypothetical protein